MDLFAPIDSGLYLTEDYAFCKRAKSWAQDMHCFGWMEYSAEHSFP